MLRCFLIFCLFNLTQVFAFDHSHQKFQAVLDSSLKAKDKQTYVNYKKLKASPAQLKSYLKDLSSVSMKEFKTFNEDQQLAFLINAYNAFTIEWILRNYPLKSIKDTGGFFIGPWSNKFFTLLGEKTTLDNIEHEMLRKNYSVPEIHYAIVCASLSCPNLLDKVFTDKNLKEHLKLAATTFLTDENKNKFNMKKGTLYLSKIFYWFGNDFTKKYKSVENAVHKYVTPNPIGQKMIRDKDVKIKYLNYDWGLNEWTP